MALSSLSNFLGGTNHCPLLFNRDTFMLRGVVVRLRTPRPVLLVEGRAIYRERFPLNAREKTPDSRAPAATILVVEDDRAVRLLFTKVLQSAGYHVVACENGSAGLEWARKHLDSLDAIVTDARMPAMGGQRLIARVRSLNPNVPAIVVSGNVIEGTPDAMTVFLCKPVTPGALTRELRRLLCDRM